MTSLNLSTDSAAQPDRQTPTAPHPASKTPAEIWRAFSASRYGWLLVGCGILLILGLIFLQDFGTSTDEEPNIYYGQLFLQAYGPGNLLRSPGIDYFNGPFYFMLFTITTRIFRFLHPAWLATDGLHLTNFFTFLVGIFFFYRFSLRLLPRNMALLLSALFAFQPVLFGHAFINQKDTPFMVFFLVSVELGLSAIDHAFQPSRTPPAQPEATAKTSPPWRVQAAWFRLVWLTAAILLVLFGLDVWIGNLTRSAVHALVAAAYHGQAPALISKLFARLATDAYKTPLPLYLDKVDVAFVWLRLALIPVLLSAALALWKIGFPSHYARFPGKWLHRWGPLLVAGCLLGLTTSIRILGPFAGALCCLYALARYRRRALFPLLGYAATAMLTTFLTWPVLWGNPVGTFLSLLSQTSSFTTNYVFFMGHGFEATHLPVIYLPLLLAIQLTLPALALFLIGIPASWIAARRNAPHLRLIVLLWIWFLLPLLAVMAGLIPVYNNFRHVLFILPPLLLIAGLGMREIMRWLRPAIARLALAALILAPGVTGILQLHPYEYIYYNQLVGGVAGAEGRFELDYWCTAFRQAMAYVNKVAPEGARLAFGASYRTALPFARPDLILPNTPDSAPPAIAMACRRDVYDDAFKPGMSIIYEVRIQGALLAIVKGPSASP
jgi:hypothetical protein